MTYKQSTDQLDKDIKHLLHLLEFSLYGSVREKLPRYEIEKIEKELNEKKIEHLERFIKDIEGGILRN